MTTAVAAVAVAAGPPPSADNPEYTRLHITPLDQSLLDIVIPFSVLPHARNISYHTVETFPEKRYGFVDLPIAHAEKLKKKLNGAVLKGVKMRVEKARPESIPAPSPAADEDDAKAKKEKKKSKKRKREDGVIPGVELEDRKVKRGWTTSEQEVIEKKRKKSKQSKKDKKPLEEKIDKKDKDKRDKKDKKDKKKRRDVKSKYTDAPECLFKTKLPDPTTATTTTSSKRMGEDDDSGHKAKKRKSGREVVIHEFEKTVKYPSFLKSKDDKPNPEAVTFQDGLGWVDSQGNVVEPLVSNRRAIRSAKAVSSTPKQPELAPADEEEGEKDDEDDDDDDDDETSSSGTSSDDEDAAEGDSDQEAESSHREPHKTGMTSPVRKLEVDTQATSSPASAAKPESARPKSSGSMNSLTIKIPPVTPAADKIHPLEALYKRPKGDKDGPNSAGQESKPFSFFDDDDDDIEEDDGAATAPTTQQPPMTPYTKQDFEFRNIRSAAPTPDTAHPSRSFSFWSRQETVDEESENDKDEEGGNGNGNDEAEEQDDDEDGDEDDDDDDDDDVTTGNAVTPHDTPTRSNKHAPPVPVSDFQKHFWENRGELNRKWRKRRREASKEKRYRENRSRAARAI
ncbi:hypothetical protein F4809DRAFT_640238 [Biscogniauxia mediterranea]|nr:hypothetical protein F4809DRAFT_640238 [Biscogniauxia mediterranea]